MATIPAAKMDSQTRHPDAGDTYKRRGGEGLEDPRGGVEATYSGRIA